MKNAAILFGALLLSSAAIPSFAQSTVSNDEGRPHTSNAPGRELTRLCRNEAKEKQLTGKERTRFLRDCQANRVPPEGSAGSSTSASGKSAPGVDVDAEGRPETPPARTSRFSKKPPTADNPAKSPSSTDAEGRPKSQR